MPRSQPDPEAKPTPKKAPASAKKRPAPEPIPVVSAEAPAASAEMLSALMAQMQLLVSEVTTLKAQVAQAPASSPVAPEAVSPYEPIEAPAEDPSLAPASVQNSIKAETDVPDHAADDWSEEALAAAVAHALANPDELPDDWHEDNPEDYGVHHEDEMPEDVDLAEKYPDLLSEIESFNMGGEDESDSLIDAVTPEEERDLLAGVAQAFELAEADELASVTASVDEKPDDAPLTADEIAALVAQSQVDASETVVTAEAQEEDGALMAASLDFLPDDAPMSADDIAALVAQSQALEAGDLDSVTNAVQAIEAMPDDAALSADDIAALVAQAQSLATPSDEPLVEDTVSQPESTPIFSADPEVAEAEIEVESYEEEDSFDDLMLDEDALAALVRQSIAAQGEELDAQAAAEAEALAAAEAKSDDDAMNDDEIAALLAQAQGASAPTSESGDLNDDEIAALFAQAQQLETAAQPTEAEPLISADQLSALLEVPDPEDNSDPVPAASMAMDADELAKLLAEATALGSDPTPNPAAQAPVAEESPAMAQPVAKAQPQVAAPVARSLVSSGEQELGAVKSVPAHLAVRALALPMRFAEGKLVCKVAEPVDRVAVDRISKATGFGIIVEPAPIAEVIQGLRQAYAEVQDAHARFAVMTGAVAKPSVMDVVKSIWNKVA